MHHVVIPLSFSKRKMLQEKGRNLKNGRRRRRLRIKTPNTLPKNYVLSKQASTQIKRPRYHIGGLKVKVEHIVNCQLELYSNHRQKHFSRQQCCFWQCKARFWPTHGVCYKQKVQG